MNELFSDRERGPRARTSSSIDNATWRAIVALTIARRDDGSLGYRFPDPCSETGDPTGTNGQAFGDYLTAHVPEVDTALTRLSSGFSDDPPPTLAVLDLLELVANSVAEPIERKYHPYFSHRHLSFDREAGLARFVADVNLLFSRRGIGFEMRGAGKIQRLGPPLMRAILATASFHTGDRDTDELLAIAMERVLSPKQQDQNDALEKLWDAFERIKTLEPGANKKVSVTALLDRAAAGTGPKFRAMLEEEAAALTSIGNEFRIRHHETDKEPLPQSAQTDALFHRLFAFVRLLLTRTGRGG